MAMDPTFDDVDETSGFWPYVEAIGPAGAKITSGIQLDPPLFGPSNPCTHSQVRVFITRAKNYLDPTFAMEDAQGPELFVDVKSGSFITVADPTPTRHWAYGHIQRAAKIGVDGGPERLDQAFGALGEASTCTRGQAAVLFLRSIGEQPVTDLTHFVSFDDVPISHPKWGYIERFYELGFTAGTGPRTFSPDAAMTREQMAVFVTRVYNIPFVTPDPPDQ